MTFRNIFIISCKFGFVWFCQEPLVEFATEPLLPLEAANHFAVIADLEQTWSSLRIDAIANSFGVVK